MNITLTPAALTGIPDRQVPIPRRSDANSYVDSHSHSYSHGYRRLRPQLLCRRRRRLRPLHTHCNGNVNTNSDCYSGNPDSDANMHAGRDLVRHFERF